MCGGYNVDIKRTCITLKDGTWTVTANLLEPREVVNKNLFILRKYTTTGGFTLFGIPLQGWF